MKTRWIRSSCKLLQRNQKSTWAKKHKRWKWGQSGLCSHLQIWEFRPIFMRFQSSIYNVLLNATISKFYTELRTPISLPQSMLHHLKSLTSWYSFNRFIAKFGSGHSVASPKCQAVSTMVVLHTEADFRLYWKLFKTKGWTSKLNRCSHKENTIVRCTTTVSGRRWR